MRARIRDLRDSDVPSLTRMWNESDAIWPGGFTSGMPLTVERMLQWNSSTDYLGALVAAFDDQVVGFCGLTRAHGEPDAAYVSVLGVHPSVLNQGYGRDLLRTAVARATELGFRRLDLDTWTANTRAIPLYKRTGFLWAPNTMVHMENFLPMLLQHDLVRQFLAGGDWYPYLRPGLTPDEDIYSEGGLPAFPYVFERNGASLRFMLGIGTGDILSFEDEELRIRTAIEQPRLVAGVPITARWHVERKHDDGTEAPVTLFVDGRGGIKASRAVADRMGKAVVFEAEALALKPTDPEALPVTAERPGLRAHVGIGDKAITLGATLMVVPAMVATAEPQQVSLAPEQPGSFWLCVRSNLPTATDVRLHFTACDDIAVRPLQSLDFHLQPEAAGSALVEATAPAGLHTVRVVPLLVGGEHGEPILCEDGMAEVAIVAGGPSDAFAYRTEWGAILENAHLRAAVTAKGGAVRLQTKNPIRDLVEQRAAIGPPFWPSEFAHRLFDVEVDVRDGRASVHLAVESAHRPGLLFRRTITITASPRLETEFSFVNSGDESYRLGVRAEHMMRLHSSLVAVPLSEGLLVDSAESADWEGGASDPDRYSETWAALERDGLTVGFVWPEGSTAEFSRRFGPFFTLPAVNVHPGCTVPGGRFVLYGGSGGWRTVRDQWRRLLSPSAPEQPPAPVRAARVAVSPGVVAWSGEPIAAELTVQHLRGRALTGSAHLALPAAWSASATDWEFAGLRRGQTASFRAGIEPRPAALAQEFPAADAASLWLDANLAIGKQSLALLALGQPAAEVRIAEVPAGGPRTIRIDNGWASFLVAPEFAASVVACERGDKNHLLSAFPTPGELVWQRPWFGGIGPALAPGGTHFHPIHAGRLHEETFDVRFPVTREYHGITWRGLELASELRRPAGVRLEVEYLTLGGSNLILAVVRLVNQTGAPAPVQSFLGCYLQVDGEVQRTVLRYLAEGEHNTRREAYDVWLAPSADWAAVENERSGLTAALISATPWAYIQAYDLGLDGAHLFNVGETLLAPGAAEEYLSLFVLTDSVEKARLYRALGWSGEIVAPPEH